MAQQRIYLTTHGNDKRLIRATSQANARNHIARNSITVQVASQDDIVALVSTGQKVEETSNETVQLEIREAA
jgi:hypothetical protein